MPRFARVEIPPIPCPTCGANLVQHGSIGFQWGFCSHPFCAGGTDYRIGDEILWRRAADQTIPAWSYFTDGSANIGDPADCNLIVRESELDSDSCEQCGYSGPGVAIQIVDGVIVSVMPRDDILDDVEIVVVTPDGMQQPMHDILC